MESIFRVLASRRRRLALECLGEHRTVTLADMAEFVAERETGEDIADLSPDRVSEVYLSLYHTHVPLLESAGVARYDQEDDLVSARAETLRSLEKVREIVDSMIENPPPESRK